MSGPHHDPARYRDRDLVPVRRALLSVSDKTGIIELARALVAAGAEIVSTGSTADTIRRAGLAVTDAGELTGAGEMLDGRVKTLHPTIHAGILADLRLEHHESELERLGITPFELVVVNLYPFADTVASGASITDTVEQIDIGGPAMVRAAAKNYANVAVVVTPERYPDIVTQLALGGTTRAQRAALAWEAFRHTTRYDTAVATWFGDTVVTASGADSEAFPNPGSEVSPQHACPNLDICHPNPGSETSPFPDRMARTWQKTADLRYGENAHQRAALYSTTTGGAGGAGSAGSAGSARNAGNPGSAGNPGIAQAEQLAGKEMSYNNYVDADAAVRAAYDFDVPAVAIIKHANPCGIAVAAAAAPDPIADAHRRALACDSVSAYGGVVAANRPVTRAMAETLITGFTEVLVAPGFEPAAREILREKKNLRLLLLPTGFAPGTSELRQVSGGILVQETDRSFAAAALWTLVAGEPVDKATLSDLEFAWRACRAVKSNAILLAFQGASVGVGMGQVNRVDSCRLAVARAGDRAGGSVAASDAFFPFADGVQILLEAGVRAFVQPGGSVRDTEVTAAVQAAGASMYVTGERHFFH